MANVNLAHMCRDGHVEIYYNDSSHELCPLCRCQNALREALQEWYSWSKDEITDKRIDALRAQFLES